MSSALRSVSRGGTSSPFLMSAWRWPRSGRSTVTNKRGAAGGLGALDHLLAEAAVAEHIELKPERRLGRRAHVLDRADRHGGEAKADAGGFGRARRQDFAVAAQQAGQAGRRNGDRHRDLFAQHGGGERAIVGVDQHALAETDRLQVVAVGPVADLVIGAAIDIVEQRARHAPARELAQVFDIGDDGHWFAIRRGGCGTGRSCGSARDKTARSPRSAPARCRCLAACGLRPWLLPTPHCRRAAARPGRA